MKLSQIVHDKRTEKGWSKTELAKRTKISIQFICDIEAGRRMPSFKNAIKLSKVLETSLDEFFLGEDYAKAETEVV